MSSLKNTLRNLWSYCSVLPPYSPEFNPAERFFGELRKATANQIFETIEDQEVVIEKKLNALTDDTEAMKKLLGYN